MYDSTGLSMDEHLLAISDSLRCPELLSKVNELHEIQRIADLHRPKTAYRIIAIQQGTKRDQDEQISAQAARYNDNRLVRVLWWIRALGLTTY
jgi:hypothetical protein